MSQYRYSLYFKIETIISVMVCLFLLILSGIKVLHVFSIWYMLLGMLSVLLLLIWIHFFWNHPSLYLDEEGYDFLPRKGLDKIGKKILWKNITKVCRHPFYKNIIWLYVKYNDPESREKIRRKVLKLYHYQEKKKLLQEIISYCQHAEIDSRLLRNI